MHDAERVCYICCKRGSSRMVSQIHFLYKSILCELKICKNGNMLVCKNCVNFHSSNVYLGQINLLPQFLYLQKNIPNYPVRCNNRVQIQTKFKYLAIK